MKAKEKAKQLLTKFYYWDYESARQCALIAVDEIIYNIPKTKSTPQLNQANIEYWNEVKTHINS